MCATLVPPALLLALIPAAGTVGGWLMGQPPLPGYGQVTKAVLEAPLPALSIIWGLYLQLTTMTALVVIPFMVGRASFWKPINRRVDSWLHQGFSMLPSRIRKPSIAALGAGMLCLLVWLAATAPM